MTCRIFPRWVEGKPTAIAAHTWRDPHAAKRVPSRWVGIVCANCRIFLVSGFPQSCLLYDTKSELLSDNWRSISLLKYLMHCSIITSESLTLWAFFTTSGLTAVDLHSLGRVHAMTHALGQRFRFSEILHISKSAISVSAVNARTQRRGSGFKHAWDNAALLHRWLLCARDAFVDGYLFQL